MKNRILYGSGALAASVFRQLTTQDGDSFSITWIFPTESDEVESSVGFVLEDFSVLDAEWETWGTGPSEKRKSDQAFREHLLRSSVLPTAKVEPGAVKRLENVEIVAVDPVKKTVRLESGEELAYDELFWTASAERLRKVGNLTVPVAAGAEGFVGLGIHLVAETATPSAARLYLGFKYRSEPYAAVGVRYPRADGKLDVRLVLPLLQEDAQDREELAKLATALRREVGRRVEELGATVIEHQFQLLPNLFTGLSRKVRSPEIAPGLFFVGPEIVCDDSLVAAPALAVCRDNTLRALESSV